MEDDMYVLFFFAIFPLRVIQVNSTAFHGAQCIPSLFPEAKMTSRRHFQFLYNNLATILRPTTLHV